MYLKRNRELELLLNQRLVNVLVPILVKYYTLLRFLRSFKNIPQQVNVTYYRNALETKNIKWQNKAIVVNKDVHRKLLKNHLHSTSFCKINRSPLKLQE